ncbi:MAG: class I SAM-dependent methyltransferase [Proteobacteria bacterium]|nr:class I SAM-dependent methyltransferase [Pseudomonadota bacterium]
MTDPDSELLEQRSHFAFGENWASYARGIAADEVEKATEGLSRLIGGRIDGKTFLDIGSGSGLHSVAALRLGARRVRALDIDPNSVETTRAVLQRFAPPGSEWSVEQKSVFALEDWPDSQFDCVYSWGVLHHTGDMYRAIRAAARQVRPGGSFVFALYRKTLLCGFWKVEKRWYARATQRSQRMASALYVTAVRIGLLLRGRSFSRYVREYSLRNRGMEYRHDVHDWLGGWPYESISPRQVNRLMLSLGFAEEKSFARSGVTVGFSGSGCDEYRFRRS